MTTNPKKKKRRIFIHPDHIEDLDERERKLKANRKEAVPTGYTTECIMRNTTRHRDMLFQASFVKEKCQSGAVFFFKVAGKEHEMMVQPIPVEFMNRTAINHIEKRSFVRHFRYRKFAYSTDMHGTPEPSTVLYNLGLSPILKAYRFRLEEYIVQDDAFGERAAYKIIPLHAE